MPNITLPVKALQEHTAFCLAYDLFPHLVNKLETFAPGGNWEEIKSLRDTLATLLLYIGPEHLRAPQAYADLWAAFTNHFGDPEKYIDPVTLA